MIRVSKRASGILAVCALAGCLGLAGCGETPASAANQQGSQPAASASGAKAADATDKTPDAAVPTVETYGNLGDFEALELDKKTTFTQEDLAKKDVTVINFWSTTCGPCVTEMPEIAKFAQQLPDNVQMVTVCLDGIYNTDRAVSVLDKAGFTGTTLIQVSGGLADLVDEIQYTPTTVFVSKDGTLVGEALVGAPKNLEEVYLEHVNEVLAWSGEKAITLDGASTDQHEDAAKAQ